MLTAFKTSKRTLAIWYALVSCVLERRDKPSLFIIQLQGNINQSEKLSREPTSQFYQQHFVKLWYIFLYPSLQSWITFLAIIEQMKIQGLSIKLLKSLSRTMAILMLLKKTVWIIEVATLQIEGVSGIQRVITFNYVILLN